jgi:hypothetical protein
VFGSFFSSGEEKRNWRDSLAEGPLYGQHVLHERLAVFRLDGFLLVIITLLHY